MHASALCHVPALAVFLVVLQAAAGATVKQSDDHTITNVVNLLQAILEKSQEESDSERQLYAKYKCWCDDNKAEKSTEIAELKTQIGLLENTIEAKLAEISLLSKDVAKLEADQAANRAAQDSATTLWDTRQQSLSGEISQLSDAIQQIDDAIRILTEIGADQGLSVGHDHTQYMANYTPAANASLGLLSSAVRQALRAASAFISKKQVAAVESFIQTPFTGTYVAQSGEVVGILKDMSNTFTANLATATETRRKEGEAFDKFIVDMQSAWDKMDASYTLKQGVLSTSDDVLAAKRTQLETAQGDLSAAQSFLDNVLDMCAAKKKEYDERVALATKERAAVAEAISILNSDAAFATFGTVTATRDGPTSFLQLRAISMHNGSPRDLKVDESVRTKTQAFLSKAAGAKTSRFLAQIAALLQADNPFTKVLDEIHRMIALIDKEEQADTDQHNWCQNTRSKTVADIGEKDDQIAGLTGEVDALDITIDDPSSGLKKQVAEAEVQLQENQNNQATETALRTKSNRQYQKDIANLVEAESLLQKAIQVLRKYYSQISSEMSAGLLQKRVTKQDPTEEPTWEEGGFKGQSGQAKSAVDMLEFIVANTQDEERQLHTDEQTNQHAYEDSMSGLKGEELTYQQNLGNLKLSLAENEKIRLEKRTDLKMTTEEKEKLEAYLVEIQPGCDFIAANLDTREAKRSEERSTLEQAINLLEGAPAYQEAMAVAHNESLGDCLSICTGAESHVDCKACLARTSVPGYCAGHPATQGC